MTEVEREVVFNEARQKRKQLNLHSIVVTGSAGKTTVKELLGAVCREWMDESHLTISEANLNTKIALATQIINTSPSVKVGIFEMGARKQRDFQIPLEILEPTTAILLNIGTAHVGEFLSIENLVNEKLSVLNAKTLKNRIIFGDDPRIINYAKSLGVNYTSFGYEKHNQVQIVKQSDYSLDFLVDSKLISIPVEINIPSLAINIAAVITASLQLGIPTEKYIHAIKKFKGVKRRFEISKWGSAEVIDDAYNASPESMKIGLEKFSQISKNKRVILVLGSMLELGNLSLPEHRKIGRYINTSFAKHIEHNQLKLVLVGAEAKEIATDIGLKRTQVNWFSDVDIAKTYLESIKDHYDLIYLKGSKSINLVKLLQSS